MTGIPHLLVHEHDDNVGVVVVEGLKSGTKMLCCITADNSIFELEAMADVPIGHKVALDDLKKVILLLSTERILENLYLMSTKVVTFTFTI